MDGVFEQCMWAAGWQIYEYLCQFVFPGPLHGSRNWIFYLFARPTMSSHTDAPCEEQNS